MELRERLVSCKKCEKRTFDSAVGIVCSLTSEKPTFEGSCADFVVDPKEAQKIQNTTYTQQKEKSESKSVWLYVGIAFIVLKIVFRLLRD